MAKRKPAPKLTDSQWCEVFDIRCRSKRGEHVSPEQLAMCWTAMRQDRARYSAMSARVFDETAPFGSRPPNTEQGRG